MKSHFDSAHGHCSDASLSKRPAGNARFCWQKDASDASDASAHSATHAVLSDKGKFGHSTAILKSPMCPKRPTHGELVAFGWTLAGRFGLLATCYHGVRISAGDVTHSPPST